MEERIKAAFDNIHADEKLKSRVRYSLRKHRINRLVGRPCFKLRYAMCCALLLICIAGFGAYRIPRASIEVDVNPSIELKVNAFDRVVKAVGMNDDGEAIVERLKLKNLKYTDAMICLLGNKDMEQYLDEDALLAITVVGPTPSETDKFMQCIASYTCCVTKEENIYYCKANPETAQAAAKMGLSVARYRALLELQKQDPEIGTEEVLEMSMREIKELIGCDRPFRSCNCMEPMRNCMGQMKNCMGQTKNTLK